MPRELKPQLVETVTYHKGGVKSDIFLNRNTLKFFAAVAGVKIENASASQLKSDVYRALVESCSYKWIPAIHVEILAPFGGDDEHFLGFKIERMYLCEKSNQRLGHCIWTAPENDRIDFSDENVHQFWPLTLPQTLGKYEQEWFLPYSEALWDGLNLLLETIAKAKAQLVDLLSSPTGFALIEARGFGLNKLLAGGQDSPEQRAS